MNSDKRRLNAIMLTDIVGYTSLSQENEERTLALLREQTGLAVPIFQGFEGTVVKSTGDGFLVVFPSAVEAARCAIAVQTKLASSQHPMLIRIGIHVGDIVHRDGDVFGDGVNVASRIEPLATPGGICLSRQAYDQVWNKIDATFFSLGARDLKHLVHPLEVFRVEFKGGIDSYPQCENRGKGGRSPGAVLASKEEAQCALDPRRIAVLPLQNLSPNASDSYLAAGMTEDLIYSLSEVAELHVIAHTTVLKFKNAGRSVSEIGRALKVGTILEGSVRKIGDIVRVVVQLISAESEVHMWAEQYDRDLRDILSIQSEISRNVASALKAELLTDLECTTLKEEAVDPKAHLEYLKGRLFLSRRTDEAAQKARLHFEAAVAIAPEYARAYSGLADVYALMVGRIPASEGFEKAKAYSHKALALEEQSAEAHATLGYVLWRSDGRILEAERELLRAIELNRNYAQAHEWYAALLAHTGRVTEACQQCERALLIDPLSASLVLTYAQSLHGAGRLIEAVHRYQEALEINPMLEGAWWGLWYSLAAQWDWDQAEQITRSRVALHPNNPFAYVNLSTCVMNRGRVEEGLAAIEKALELEPEPRRSSILFPAGVRYYYARDFDKALGFFRQTLERDSRLNTAHLMIAQIHIHYERYDEALEEVDAAERVFGGKDPFWQVHVHRTRGVVYARQGEREKSEAELAILIRSSGRQNRKLAISGLLAELGRVEEAMDWLEEAATDREAHIASLRITPAADVMRFHPRFQAILKRIGLSD